MALTLSKEQLDAQLELIKLTNGLNPLSPTFISDYLLRVVQFLDERAGSVESFVTETNSSVFIQQAISNITVMKDLAVSAAANSETSRTSSVALLDQTMTAKSDAETIKAQVITLKNTFDQVVTTARIFQDSWNIATNVPNLAGLGLNNTTDKGKFWKVAIGGAGTTTITGTSETAKEGDEFTWNGTKWVHTTSSLALSDGQVEPKNTSFILAGKNLADPSKFTDGNFIENTGVLNVNAAYGYTDFIPVKVGATYSGSDGITKMRKTCYYDVNKVVVAGGSTNDITSFTIPANVAYVRVTYYVNRKSTFQFELAAAPTVFEAYYGYKASGYKTGADLITQDTVRRMVSDVQISTWDQKVASSDIVSEIIGKSKNLFQTTNIATGSGNVIDTGSGGYITIAGWIRTGAIPVDPSTDYMLSGLISRQSKAVRFEDAAGVFLSYQPAPTPIGTTLPIATPAGAAKMYITLQRSDEVINLNTIQIEKGTVATFYVAYNAGLTKVKSIKGLDIPIRTIAGKTGDTDGAVTLTPADVSLSLVNNTPDSQKPVSIPQQAAFDLKLNKDLVVSEMVGATKNLANPAEFTDNFFLETGNTTTANVMYGYTGFIAVVPGQTYSGSDGVNGMRKTTYFNTLKVNVTGGSTNTITTFTVPDGVYWVKVTYFLVRKSTFQFELAIAPTAYIAFSAGIKTLKNIDGAAVPSGGTAPSTAETLTLANASKIMITGCSYDESMYTHRGKSWINKLSNYTDWMIANVGVSGQRIMDVVDRLRKDTATYLVKPSTYKPTYIFIGNNGNEYFPASGENLDLYEEQHRIAVEAVQAWGAKPIFGTNYHVNTNVFLESGLKYFADRNKINYFGIGLNGEKIMSPGYQGFWAGSHPGVRTNSYVWQEWNYFLQQLHRPAKAIKIFRPRTAAAIADLNYDTIPQRMERFIEINVGERALNEANASEAYYDRLNEGTTIDPNDENNIITNYSSQANNNEYASLINDASISFNDFALFELIIDRVQPTTFIARVKGDAGLSFYVKNNNDPAAYESAGRDKELVFQVTEAVYNNFIDPVGTKFTSPGVKGSSVQFAYSGKLKSYPMGKGWFLCFTADADVDQGNRISATVKIVHVSDSVEIETVNQKSPYRYGYSFFANMNKPKGTWKLLTTEVVYANGLYTITLSGNVKYFQFDKLKLVAAKAGAFAIGGIEAEYTGGTPKPSYTKEVEQKAFGDELISTRGFDANWNTTGGWTDGGNSLVSMPVGVRDYPPFLTTTNHVELGFDANGFSRKITRAITLPMVSTDRRGWQKVVVRIVARLFPKIFNAAQSGEYFTDTPLISKASYDLGVVCVGFKKAGSASPETVLRQYVDIGWSELAFETTLPIMEGAVTMDIWRDCEVSNVNPSYPLQVYDVSFQVV